MTFWMVKTFVEPSNQMILDRVKEFEKQNNVKVDVKLAAYEDFRPLWAAGIESGNLPDVSYMAYQEVGAFYRQGVLMDLSDLMKQIQDKNGQMTESVVRVISFDSKQWAVPYYPSATILFYRKDLFKKAGISKAPDTWQEFIDDAKKLTDAKADVYGAGLGLGRNDSDAEWWTRQIMWSQGAALFSKDGLKATVDSPEGIKAYEMMKTIFTSDITPPGAIGWDDSGNNKAYLAGQAAMIINVGSVYYTLQSDPAQKELFDNTGYALVPQGPNGRFINGISNNLGIFKKAKNPELAKKLIAFLLDKDFQKEWMKASGYQVIPVYPDLAKDPFWDSEAGKVFTETPKYFQYLGYAGPFTPAAGEVYNQRLGDDTIEKILVQNKPIDAAVKQLNVDVQKIIDKYNK